MTIRARRFAGRLFGALLPLALLAACGGEDVILPGERLDLREDRVTAQAQVDRALPISLPAALMRDAWTHRASDAAHDIPHAALSPLPRPIFSVPIGQGENRRHRISADPVVADGRVFTVDSRARVTAHGTDGRTLWSVDLTPPGDPGDASGAGLAVEGGRLFVSTAFGDLVALDPATGRRFWAQDLGAAAAGAPTVSGGIVYVVARDATAWAIDVANGRVRWTEQGTPSLNGVVGGAAPAISGEMIVLPFASRELAGVLRQGGTRLWTANVAGTRLGEVYATIGDISGDPVIEGGRVYAGNPSGRTAAFDLRSGEQIWSARDGAMSPVLVAGGSVFSVSDQAELLRLDAATGERIWGTELPYLVPSRLSRRRGVVTHYGPILAGGRLWVASGDGRLRAFSPQSGALLAEIELPGGAATNPVVAGGALYVVSQDGQLLAFR
ncbi:outer membrane protein assembly factor BamB [Palleronia aestuarii]|uniref:Outer membrane protein assembly factor BamB n=1 Tax=Palleronia aestuarii TaxID=568105 RepID=A0A2W7P2D5_9RHOB|nr:PQQ-binding-like beta-propeller repeat protein [Palleronia aestuarii]PZX17602.1 outer membrane protein assembly factor BamB [Palleronia aestuarii]